MTWRNAPALLAMIAITTTAFAGCINPADLMNAASQKSEISAMEDRDLAANAAKAWDPDAQLVSVFSLELSSNPETGDIPLDPTPGNGKAPLWYYVYCVIPTEKNTSSEEGTGGDAGSSATSDMKVRAFRVSADGRVKAENDTPMPAMPMGSPEMKDIGAWSVDSVKALDAAKRDEKFSTVLHRENVSLAEGVAAMDGLTAWYFAAITEGAGAIAIVDATNGKLVSVHEFNADFGKVPHYARATFPQSLESPLDEEGRGNVDAARQTAEFPFEYGGGKTVATLTFRSQGQLPTDGISWKLVDPAGQPVKPQSGGSGSSMFSGDQKMTVKYALKDAGSYSLIVSYRGFPPLPAGPGPAVGAESFQFRLTNLHQEPKGDA